MKIDQKQLPTGKIANKAIKELEMIAKDKKNKKILESFKEQLFKSKTVTT